MATSSLQRLAKPFNKAVVAPLVRSPRWGRLLGGFTVLLTYTGRRSGRTFTVPVCYSRHAGDVLRIRVALPEKKAWWRNFDGDGAPVSLTLQGVQRTGNAVVHRDGRGRMTVAVHLDAIDHP